jgi:xanthine dehydrogenase accessory factor
LERALRIPAAYVGLVASRRRAQSVLARLRRQGVPEADLARVQAPAGLDLGRISHTEIAVSILAQLVGLRAAGRLTMEMEASAHGTEALDPVCGMTVDVSTANHRLTHEGHEYVFCAAGCRERFLAELPRYAAMPS